VRIKQGLQVFHALEVGERFGGAFCADFEFVEVRSKRADAPNAAPPVGGVASMASRSYPGMSASARFCCLFSSVP